MTLNQLQTLTEDELAMALYIVNVIDPLTLPQMEFTPQQLVWFKHDMLIQKLLNAFPRLKPEAFSIYLSLMEKLGVKVEIRQTPQPELPTSSSTANETTGSNVHEHIC
jgi:hypothetical protein